MNKLYDRINWHNNTTPALNESNLNAMSKAIDDIDNRIIDIADEVVDNIAQIRRWYVLSEQNADRANRAASTAQGYASTAHAAEIRAGNQADDSEAWAVGQINGSDVSPSDIHFHNNSKWFAEQSADSATEAEGYKDDCEDIKDEIIDAIGAPTFTINFVTGELEYDPNITYNFTINTTTGNLEWEVVA